MAEIQHVYSSKTTYEYDSVVGIDHFFKHYRIVYL